MPFNISESMPTDIFDLVHFDVWWPSSVSSIGRSRYFFFVFVDDYSRYSWIPSPVIQNQTPYERLFGSPPDYHHLRCFGSTCFILLQPHEHNKLELLV